MNKLTSRCNSCARAPPIDGQRLGKRLPLTNEICVKIAGFNSNPAPWDKPLQLPSGMNLGTKRDRERQKGKEQAGSEKVAEEKASKKRAARGGLSTRPASKKTTR
jgi:hypothetical protein